MIEGQVDECLDVGAVDGGAAVDSFKRKAEERDLGAGFATSTPLESTPEGV